MRIFIIFHRPKKKLFAFDLKAMWDYGLYVVLIGVWADHNLLLNLNSDLAGRVHEISILWTKEDLRQVINKGSPYLNISFSEKIKDKLIELSFETVGLIQKLVINILDDMRIDGKCAETRKIENIELVDNAAMQYADQLNAIYHTFATRLSGGIRRRANSTGIYAYALAEIMSASDVELSKGLSIDVIFNNSHKKQNRIQKANLRTVLEKLDSLQVDLDGRGLIFSYSNNAVFVVDKQILLYRRYATIKWPWEEMISEAGASDALAAD